MSVLRSRILRIGLALLVGCGDPAPLSPPLPSPNPTGTPGGPGTAGPGAAGPAPQRERNPVIPADSPAWAAMSGFVPEPGFYGERSWDDVRMRVVGHLATIGRDRARARAMAGDWAGCAAAYAALVGEVEAVPTASATGAPIRAALIDAARRDGALCATFAAGKLPSPGPGIAGLRAAGRAGAPRGALDARAATIDLDRSDLALDAFEDFDARHALRVRLVTAWADAVDPFWPSDPWGHWTAAALREQVTGLLGTAVSPADPADPAAAAQARDPRAPGRAVVAARPRPGFHAEDLGALPTGDTLVDSAGFPGPTAIGKLAVLGLDDPAHRAWLEEQAAALDALPDAAVPDAVAAMVAALDRQPYGSRYYNIKQARNAAVRVLAGRGAFGPARAVLAASWPLHHQDHACPNREGILRAIEGRLLLAAGDPSAEAVLAEAAAASARFLAKIREAESRGGPPPPPAPPG